VLDPDITKLKEFAKKKQRRKVELAKMIKEGKIRIPKPEAPEKLDE
jgi:hypothetical protein